LTAGNLLGNDNDLPAATKQAYQNTGTAHIIAISGFNMAILATLFLALFTQILNRYWAAILSALVLTLYTLFVEGSPSVVRAAIMAIMAFFGILRVSGKIRHPIFFEVGNEISCYWRGRIHWQHYCFSA
jgi:competence protein ComEC